MDPILKSKTVWRRGSPMAIESVSLSAAFAAVFEDDGESGYLYAIDRSGDLRPESPIAGPETTSLGRTYKVVETLHIYDAESKNDKPEMAELCWSPDGTKVALRLGKEFYAVLDFAAKQGVCRTGFPPPSQTADSWKADHEWDARCLEPFL